LYRPDGPIKQGFLVSPRSWNGKSTQFDASKGDFVIKTMFLEPAMYIAAKNL